MKRNTLTTAVLAGLTGMAGMVSVSNAVNVNPDGLGQVLLYPFYTARGGNDTLISIVNTTERGKAVKIRFIEALNSREVLDFNIYMSPFDVWTGAVTEGAAGGGKLLTADTTCTVRYFVGEAGGAGNIGEVGFLDFQYASGPVLSASPPFAGTIDGGPQGLERTASGYIEIIEMGTMLAQPGAQPGAGSPSLVPWSAKHVNGVPRNCDYITSLWAPNTGTWAATGGNNPTFGFDTDPTDDGIAGATGGIFGAASIINVAEGTMYSYNAVAIDGFWSPGTTVHTDPGSLSPSLADGNGSTSNVFINGTLSTLSWPAGPFAVNATLTLAELMNEYTIESGLAASTEWVLTFPTKRFHTDAAVGGPDPSLAAPIPPFTDRWTWPDPLINPGANPKAFSCETLSFAVWDREERVPDEDPGTIIISPPPPPGAVDAFQLCREANVIRFANDGSTPDATEILGEPLRADHPRLSYTNFNLPESFESGWVRFDFSTRQSIPSDDGITGVLGLPVVGFSVTRFTNGIIPDGAGGAVLANYGGTFVHRGSRAVGDVN